MKKEKLLSLFLINILAILFLISNYPAAALAEDAADDSDFLMEEFVVTAEFREKTIQDTPLAITAINAEGLESRGQVSLDDISSQIPGVTLAPNNASMGSSLVAFIRGIGQTDFNPAVEPGVGIYVDDVYYSTIPATFLICWISNVLKS